MQVYSLRTTMGAGLVAMDVEACLGVKDSFGYDWGCCGVGGVDPGGLGAQSLYPDIWR